MIWQEPVIALNQGMHTRPQVIESITFVGEFIYLLFIRLFVYYTYNKLFKSLENVVEMIVYKYH